MISVEEFRKMFGGTVRLSELKPLPNSFCKAGNTHALCVCPCGGTNHAATIATDFNTGASVTASPVLHCWETNQQWMIIKDIETIIKNEEVKYFALLDRFAASPFLEKPVSAKEAFRLCTEQGVPEGMLEIEGIEEFSSLMAIHRKKSKRKGTP